MRPLQKQWHGMWRFPMLSSSPHPALSRQGRGFYLSRMVRVRFEFDDAFPDG